MSAILDVVKKEVLRWKTAFQPWHLQAPPLHRLWPALPFLSHMRNITHTGCLTLLAIVCC